ncbi:type II toxin-antitoxin system Y4mF family antitoxin [Nostocoides veronense]|uniref:HTH cro/C1-type domain-containing protein n=1 Tax=Nostocoides veronense TaxID=330836 RepID=A0ABN2LBJ3_9MICO
MSDWATLVSARREELRLRQRELAALAGVSERFVREVESGKQTVRVDKPMDLLDVLGLELSVVPRTTP